MGKEKKLIKIGELAKLAGVLPSTIDFYVNNGLLKEAGRSQGDYRLFDEAESLRNIREIKTLQEKKRLTIQEIKKRLHK